MKYFVGIFVMVVGSLMVIKTQWFVSNFGHSEWAETKIGSGGTYLLYKVLGITFIILALMGMTGMLGEVIFSVFGRLFSGLA
ncbi:hypothetical protein C0581_04360 [Candidatus Parcubacteria bacterium]|nr:MAG: hypothetical protein C0581_04360 [Candidatus Parcubacteria bacterium]